MWSQCYPHTTYRLSELRPDNSKCANSVIFSIYGVRNIFIVSHPFKFISIYFPLKIKIKINIFHRLLTKNSDAIISSTFKLLTEFWFLFQPFILKPCVSSQASSIWSQYRQWVLSGDCGSAGLGKDEWTQIY